MLSAVLFIYVMRPSVAYCTCTLNYTLYWTIEDFGGIILMMDMVGVVTTTTWWPPFSGCTETWITEDFRLPGMDGIHGLFRTNVVHLQTNC